MQVKSQIKRYTIISWAFLCVSVVSPFSAGAQIVQKLAAPDTAVEDQFGISIAIQDDLLVVGANHDAEKGEKAGAVYIYREVDRKWQLEQKITAEDGEEGDSFGVSVAIDGGTVVVGAVGWDGQFANEGAVYVFVQEGSEWQQVAVLDSQNGLANDGIGYSVSIKGDLILAGARGDDENGNSAGAGVSFLRDFSGWHPYANVIANDGGMGHLLGTAIGLSNQYAFLSAPLSENDETASGAVYVFQPTGIIWPQRAKLFIEDGQLLDQFGASLSVFGNELVVGALGHDTEFVDVGMARHYVNVDGNWILNQELTPGIPRHYLRYGKYVAMSQIMLAIAGEVGSSIQYYQKRRDQWWYESFLQVEEVNELQITGIALDVNELIIGTVGSVFVVDIPVVLTNKEKEDISVSELEVEVYPVPFVLELNVKVGTDEAGPVNATIYDIRGRMLWRKEIQNGAGQHLLTWKGDNDQGKPMPAGVYLLKVESAKKVFTKGLVKL